MTPTPSYTYRARVVRIHDGDTLTGSHMPPGLAVNYVRDRRRCHAMRATQGTQRFARAMPGTNLYHLFFRQLRVRISRATHTPLDLLMRGIAHTCEATALFFHITGIVRCCPQEKVRRVDAQSIVAVVADVQSVRDRTVGQFPGKAMGGMRAIIDTQATVPIRRDRSRMRPAFAGTTRSRPEPFGQRGARATEVIATARANRLLTILTGKQITAMAAGVGILGTHGDLLNRCATPPVVSSDAGAFVASIIPQTGG